MPISNWNNSKYLEEIEETNETVPKYLAERGVTQEQYDATKRRNGSWREGEDGKMHFLLSEKPIKPMTSEIMEWLPVIGDTIEAGHVANDLAQGNYGNALLGAGLMIVPGTVASKVGKKLNRLNSSTTKKGLLLSDLLQDKITLGDGTVINVEKRLKLGNINAGGINAADYIKNHVVGRAEQQERTSWIAKGIHDFNNIGNWEIIKGSTGNNTWYGLFDPQTKQIIIDPKHSGFRTLIHEIRHKLDKPVANSELRIIKRTQEDTDLLNDAYRAFWNPDPQKMVPGSGDIAERIAENTTYRFNAYRYFKEKYGKDLTPDELTKAIQEASDDEIKKFVKHAEYAKEYQDYAEKHPEIITKWRNAIATALGVSGIISTANGLQNNTKDQTKQYKSGGELKNSSNEIETIEIEINDEEYKVLVARTEEEKEIGLQNVIELDDDEGMLFIYDKPQELSFWMKDCNLHLAIIFIDENYKIISIKEGIPNSEEALTEYAQYVLELKWGVDVNIGDVVEIDNEDYSDLEPNKMYVIGSDGNPQAELQGSERIFSIKHTKVLLQKARKAFKSKSDSDYKSLGKSLFKFLDTQDSQKQEYVGK